ncbi:sensor histidine kinase [Chryseobacterium sp. cx-311]|uniref:sensor histidine kinase n=1 Tax=Marnyiella aurantia TaxID=2758037 RepID=UPI001AEA9572|nr:sensor histidine kinase [Marnyiella aurantia]MBP0611579.1 sensor histidine kinase [Marnyiella aurantia]
MQSGTIVTHKYPNSRWQPSFGALLILFILCWQSGNAQYASVIENITENEGLPTNYIFNITQDHNGFLWLGSDKGLIKYSNGKFLTYDADNSGLPGNYIHHAVADGKSGMFICAAGKDLVFFDTDRTRVTHRYHNLGRKGLTYGLYRSDVHPDFTVFASESEPFIYAINRNRLTEIIKIFAQKQTDGKGAEQYFSLIDGRRVLVATGRFKNEKTHVMQSGIKYSPKFGVGIVRSAKGNVLDTISEKNGLESHMLTDFHRTADGHLYFSSLGGGFSFIRNEGHRKAYPLENGKVRAIGFHNNKYYVLSRGSVFVLNSRKIESRLSLGRDALTLFIDKDLLYAGTFKGLVIYRLGEKHIRLLKSIPFTDGISRIFKTADGKTAFSSYGNGMFIQEGEEFRNIRLPVFNNIENLFKGQKGNYFATSYESGYTELNSDLQAVKSYSRENGLNSNNINYLFSEKDTLWVGSPTGISGRLNNKQFQRLSAEQGFSGHQVKCIFRCKQGRLWIVTNTMIMEKVKEELRPFGSFSGYGGNSPYITYAHYIPEKDELLIATKNRLSVFAMREMKPNRKVETPVLKHIEADGRVISPSNHVELQHDNLLTVFSFGTVDKDFLDHSKLYYKLGGADWLPFTDGNLLKITHQSSGRHLLQVKSRNQDGYEKMYPADIQIWVQPPFYRSWWFVLSAIITLVGVSSFVVYQYYRSKYESKLHESKLNEEIEDERRRISRDLHDNIGAYTTSLIMRIENLEQKNGDRGGDLKDIREISYQIMSLLRQTIWVLKMRETTVENCYEGLLSYSTRYFKTVPDIQLNITENIAVNRSMESSKSISVFRIVQEALHNIVKHSGADRVDIHFESTDKLRLTVRDNGKGFSDNEKSNGFGISNMKARANEMGFELKMKTGPEGTEITIEEQ